MSWDRKGNPYTGIISSFNNALGKILQDCGIVYDCSAIRAGFMLKMKSDQFRSEHDLIVFKYYTCSLSHVTLHKLWYICSDWNCGTLSLALNESLRMEHFSISAVKYIPNNKTHSKQPNLNLTCSSVFFYILAFSYNFCIWCSGSHWS